MRSANVLLPANFFSRPVRQALAAPLQGADDAFQAPPKDPSVRRSPPPNPHRPLASGGCPSSRPAGPCEADLSQRSSAHLRSSLHDILGLGLAASASERSAHAYQPVFRFHPQQRASLPTLPIQRPRPEN